VTYIDVLLYAISDTAILLYMYSARRAMDAKIKDVAKECGEAEVQRMKDVTKRTMQDSSELYGFLLTKVQPAIGQLMDISIEQNKRNNTRQLFVDSLQDFTDRIQRKSQQQVQVRCSSRTAAEARY
jgi:hypothetical protein